MESKDKITIIDVARKAGVSKGTVDRVVHNRGEVSEKSAEKVRKAIQELNYQPNLYASMLATRKVHVIVCVLPKFTKGEFWEKLYDGFLQGGEHVTPLNIHTRVLLYDQYDPDSFNKVCRELLESSPSGVVLPPLFKNDTIDLTAKLKEKDIPYVFVDSKLEDSDYFAYYGMPMYKSGRLCANLLTERLRPEDVDEVAVIRINRDRTRRSDPTQERRAGFMDYMESNFPGCRIHQVFIDTNKTDGIEAVLEEFFDSHPEIKLIVMFNSRIHLLADYLRNHPSEGRRVIGFDDLEKNVAAVKEDLVSILITEHIEEQTRNAVTTLADYIFMYKQPARKDNYMHMDILTKYNLDNY